MSEKRSAGMPSGHPDMKSFLGIPIRIGDRAFGNLYLTNKRDADSFSERDEAIVAMLAAHAAVSIENARQFHTLQRLLGHRSIQTMSWTCDANAHPASASPATELSCSWRALSFRLYPIARRPGL